MDNKVLERYEKYVEKNKPELTVFMTVHNREKYICEAIDSVLNNTLKNYYFIFLDNCSTDKTAELIKGYVSREDNLEYIYRESTIDYSNFQYAVDMCITDYFVVLHDDDLACDNLLERLLISIKDLRCDALSSISQNIDENGYELSLINNVVETVFFSGIEYLSNYLKKDRITMCFPSTIYKKEFFVDKTNYFTLKCGPCFDDFLYFQICRMGGTIGIIPEKLLKYRIHSGQMSNYAKVYMYLDLYNFMLKDDYYKEILRSHMGRIPYDLWVCFKRLFKAYNNLEISKEEYKSIFDLEVYKFVKNSFKGRVICLSMKIIYSFNDTTWKILRLFKIV